MNILEIKSILINRFSKDTGADGLDRDLVVWQPQTGADCYIFALSGTPPKGYAIYSNSSEKRTLFLYDFEGKKFKEFYLPEGIEFN